MYISGGYNNLIIQNILANNGGAGLRFHYGDSNTISRNHISKNLFGIKVIYLFQNNRITYNSITGNLELGVNATDSYVGRVPLMSNWWGDSSGPYHETLNPEGGGMRSLTT